MSGTSSYRLSYWEREHLVGSDIDLAIIGAGIVGLCTAIYYKRIHPTAKVVIFEKMPLGAGASSRNAGFACIGSTSEILSDINIYGEAKALSVVKQRYDGLERLKSLVGPSNIYYQHSAHGCEVFTDAESFEKYSELIDGLNDMLCPITKLRKTFEVESINTLGFYHQGLINRAEGLLNTGLLYSQLESLAVGLGVKIIRGVSLRHFESNATSVSLYFEKWVRPIHTRNLAICTNAFTQNLLPEMAVTPSRNQVVVTSIVDTTHIPYGYHFDKGYIYFRAIGDRVLIGGARHHFPQEDGQRKFGSNEANIEFLKQFLQDKVLTGQSFNIEYSWSGILCGGENRDPIVNAIGDRVFVGLRLGGMGVAIGAQIAYELATMISGRSL